MFWLDILNFFYLAIILLVSIWLHEYAHARTSFKLWDPTPKIQNRLTPNPIAHLDILWFILIFLINFWWWKPVQVNPRYYKNPLRDELVVAIAWPLTNLFLAIFWVLILFIYWKFVLMSQNLFFLYLSNDLIVSFWKLFALVNLWLAIFNMLPIWPLDWFRLIKYFFPEIWFYVEQNQHIFYMIFLFIIFIPQTISLIRYFISSVSEFFLDYIIFFFNNIFF